TIEEQQLDIEKQRLDLEKQRFDVEKLKTQSEKQFLNQHFGAVITALVSLAAIVVSLSQVWVAKTYQDKALKDAENQRLIDNERISIEKDREYNLARAKFVTENGETLFKGAPKDLQRMAFIIELLFTQDDSHKLFEDLFETANSPEAKKVWGEARNSAYSVLVFHKSEQQATADALVDALLSAGFKSSSTPTYLREAIRQLNPNEAWVIYTSRGKEKLSDV